MRTWRGTRGYLVAGLAAAAFWCCGLAARAQVGVFLSGPSEAGWCDTVIITNEVMNLGETLSGLVVTQSMPNGGYIYVPSNSLVMQGAAILRSGLAADPAFSDGTNYVWDLSALATSGGVSHILITEVLYRPTNAAPNEAYEWIELYNPTTNAVGMTNWAIVDVNPGVSDTLPTTVIGPGQFLIVAASTSAFFSTYPGYTGVVIEVADHKLGSGLNEFGDGVFLRNGLAQTVDAMSYGDATAAFNPAVSLVPAAGWSSERHPANEDSNTSADWRSQGTPSPGAGEVRSGIEGGQSIFIVSRYEVTCEAIAGDVVSSVHFQQPSGGPTNTGSEVMFLTLNIGNLTVQKIPVLQSAGYHDLVSWNIIVRNEGFGNTPNVAIMDTLGPGLSFVGFSAQPTNAVWGTNVVWDATVIPALANLAPGAQAMVTVTARVEECYGLYDDADARWGCSGFVAATNAPCEFTATRQETARATIDFINRYPIMSGAISPAASISVSYCNGTDLTITITNKATAGPARNLELVPFLSSPAFVLSTNGVPLAGNLIVGSVEPGDATNVTVHLEGSGCPVPTDEQFLMFQSQYTDLCGNPFSALALLTTFHVTDIPYANVYKQIPSQISGSQATTTVTVLLVYSNFSSTAVTVIDTYPADAGGLLSATNFTAGGVDNGTFVSWSPVLDGSGVFTGKFDLVVNTGADQCEASGGVLQNLLEVIDYTDCQGCTRSVEGSGVSYPVAFYPSCPGGGTNSCSVTNVKEWYPALAEVCETVTITQRFTFAGSLPSNHWGGVVFSSDLGGGATDTNQLRVYVEGVDVTSWVTVSNETPNLELTFNGLTNTVYSKPSLVTNFTVVWTVWSTNVGVVTEQSSLSLVPCWGQSRAAIWAQGQSRVEVTLSLLTNNMACGVAEMRLTLTNLPSPLIANYPSSTFPVYDAVLVMNLDADADGNWSYDYVTNTTRYTNMLNIGGGAIASAEPVVSTNLITWNLGDLASNGAGVVTFRIRASCDKFAVEKHSAYILYNNACSDGNPGRSLQAHSGTNNVMPQYKADLLTALQPQFAFLTTTQYVVRIEVFNSGAGDAYELETWLTMPSNIVFSSASVAPVSVTSTSVLWRFHTTPTGDLMDLDGDGRQDDLAPNGTFVLWVTNVVDSCGSNVVGTWSTHGCKNVDCQTTTVVNAEFMTAEGDLVTRVVFPDERRLCSVAEAEYSLRNAGLVTLYDVQAKLQLPDGISYLTNTTRYVIGGVTNAVAGNPTGTGSAGDPLVWDSSLIPQFLALLPTQTVTIVFSFPIGCEAATGSGVFRSMAEYVDLCGLTNVSFEGTATANVKEPVLSVLVAGSRDGTNYITAPRLVQDVTRSVSYRVTLQHAAQSEADVNALRVTFALPTNVTYVAGNAWPAPTNSPSGLGATLIWDTATLLAGLGGAPYTNDSPAIVVTVTGQVFGCTGDVNAAAFVEYGCSETNMCLNVSDTLPLRTQPAIAALTANSQLSLTSCGGTLRVLVTNDGATATAEVFYQVAPTGYIVTAVDIAGEFNGNSLIVTLGGTPLGTTATLDLTSTNASGATDLDDDLLDGADNLDLGYGNGFVITYHLISAGTTLDCTADPLDLDFDDPDPGQPFRVTGVVTMEFANSCGFTSYIAGAASVTPDRPDPDIDLQPNSLIVTNGQASTFTVTVVNRAERGNAENLHVRVRFGSAWTSVTLVSSNLVESGGGTLSTELYAQTNFLVDLPNVILDPLDDFVELVFSAVPVEGAGDLNVFAEVVGDCDNASIVPSCSFLNTRGESPLANSVTGSVVGAVNGQYYGFDQDQTTLMGYELTKTVRYAHEGAGLAGTSRTARVGEDLIYRIEARFFGNAFSNVAVLETLPVHMAFGLPIYTNWSGAITNVLYDPASGIFTMQPYVLTNAVSTFTVDIPAIASNRLGNQDGLFVTNVADATFLIAGLTNDPLSSATVVEILEPVLRIVKTASATGGVDAGATILFTNVVSHTGASRTNAYDLAFRDTLPPGLTFAGLNLGADGIDNDADGVADGADAADEASLVVSPSLILIGTNNNPALTNLSLGATVTFIFPALVSNQLIGATMVNTSVVNWTSLPGDGTNGNERTGVDGPGGLNDYTTNSTVAITTERLRGMVKTFISSSQDNTVDGVTNDVTIGERVVYRIRVNLPEGVTTNLTITDQVPPGMDWVGTNTAAGLAFPGFGYQIVVGTSMLWMPTNTAEGLTIIDPDTTSGTSTNIDGSGDDIVFRFAAITNAADNDTNNDYFDLFMEFVVLNETINKGLSTNYYTSTNVAVVSDFSRTVTSTGPVYRVVEPDLQIYKTASPTNGDAGDLITFTVIVSNRVQALANAYDMQAVDLLATNLYDSITFTNLDTPPGWTWSTNETPPNFVYTLASDPATALAPGAAVTGRFAIALAQSVRARYSWTNLVRLTASDTISNAPPADIPDRDQTNQASVVLTVTNGTIAKTLYSTSESNSPPDSTDARVQVGEIVTYALRVALPESTVTNLAVTDRIPRGMRYVTNRVDASGFSGTLPLPPTVTGGVTNGGPVTLTFTNATGYATVVTSNNVPSDNIFWVYVDAVVLNTNNNRGQQAGSQTTFTNQAEFTFSGGIVVQSGTVVTTNVEPRIFITKSFNTNTVDAGDVVTVSLVVSNTGLAAAYDLVVSDRLDSVYFDITTVSNFTVTGTSTGFVMEVSNTINTVFIRSDPALFPPTNSLGTNQVLTFKFDVSMSQSVPPSGIVTNTAVLRSDTISTNRAPDEQRSHAATNSATLTVNNVLQFDKALFATSETNSPPDSTNDFAQIGEVLTFRLAAVLPESTISNLVFTDVLPPGLAYVVGSARVDTNTFNGILPGTTNVTPNVPPLGTNGEAVTITLVGDTVVANDNDGSNNRLVVWLQAVVLDTNVNRGLPASSVLTNRASLTYVGNAAGPYLSSNVLATVIEPRLTLTKAIVPATADAGDLVDMTFTVGNTGNAAAYDITLSDPLNAIDFNPSSATAVSVPTGFVFEVIGNSFYLKSDTNSYPPASSVEPGETLVFTVRVTVAQSAPPSFTVTNTATITGDSLYRTNAWGIQRAAAATNSAVLRGLDLSVAKVLYATGESNTPPDSTGADLQIGERVTYRLTVAAPEGTVSNLSVRDLIPRGLQYMNYSVDTNAFLGTLPLPPVVTGGATNGDPVTFTFTGDTVVTADNNAANNSFLLYVEAVALNTNANRGQTGALSTTHTNWAVVSSFSTPSVTSLVSVVTTNVEPLVGIQKYFNATNVDAGDVVAVSLVVSNIGRAAAYDLVVTDALNNVYFDTASVGGFQVNGMSPTGFVMVVSNDTVWIRSDTNTVPPTNSLDVGESIVFSFNVTMAQSLPPRITVTNIAAMLVDTISGTNSVEQRTEPRVAATNTLSVTNLTISKVLAGTSEVGVSDSTDPNVQIGESATYRLTVTLPEGTVTNLVVTDTIPTGMTYMAGSVVVDTTGFGGSLPGAPGVVDNGTNVVFSFAGNTVVTGDNNAGNNGFVVQFSLLVRDLPFNDGLLPAIDGDGVTVLTNVATVAWAGNPPAATSGVVTVTVVEPSLLIFKTMTGPVAGVVTMDLTVTNRGTAAAYDVVVTDVVKSVFFQTATIANTVLPPGFLYSVSGAPGDATVVFQSDPSGTQPSHSIEPGESLLFRFTALLATNATGYYTNIAVVATNTTTDGTNVNERYEPPVAATNVLGLPQFGITKSVVSPVGRPADVGEGVIFLITVTNTGVHVFSTVRVDDVYDTNYLAYASAIPTENVASPGSITWSNIGPLAVGASVSITAQFTAVKSTLPGVTTNTVTGSIVTTNSLTLPPKTAEVPKQIVAPAYLLAKTLVSPLGRPADVGETVTFRLSVTNIGETVLSPVRLDDTFDTNYLAYSTASVGPDSNLVGQLVWTNVGPLAIGAGTSLTVDFTAVKSTTPGDTTNTVVSTVTTTNGIPVPPQTSSVPKQVLAPAYLLSKTLVSPLGRPADVGETVTFRLAVTNIGETVLSPVRLDDTFDTNYLAYSGASIAPDLSGIGTRAWLNVGPLAVGAGTSLTVDFTAVKSTTPGNTTNTVVSTVTTTNNVPVPPQTSSVPKQVLAPAYLLTKTLVSPLGRPADVGETVVFRLSVTNIGETALSPVRLDDTFDTNYLAYSTASVGPDSNLVGQLVWTNVGPLAIGAGTSLTVDFTAVKSTTPGDTTNTVVSTVTTTNGIPVPPQTSSVPKQVLAPAYLLSKTLVSPLGRPADVGETVVFRLSVTNIGETALSPVRLDDTFDTNYLAYSTASVAPDLSGVGSRTWLNVGPLAVGAGTSLTVDFTAVKSTTPGDTTNTVVSTVTTTNGIPVPPQTSSVPKQVLAPAYLLSKTLVSPLGRPADVGETVVFRLSVTNIGETTLSPVRLDDTFDTNYLSYSTASVGPDTVGIGALTWNNVGPLAIGAGTSLTVDFTAVRSTTPGDTTNTVVSTVTTTNGIPVPPQTSSVPKQVLAPAYLLSKTLVSPLGRPADVGETVRFRLSVTNIGETALSPVRLDDTFDTNYLAYSTASVAPDLSGVGSRTWLNVGPLAVGAGTSLTVDFTAVKSTTPGDTTNTVVSTVTTTNGIPVAPQTSSVPKQVLAPAYLLSKTLVSPLGRPADVGETVRFRLSVTNIGETALSPVRLDDTFDTNYLAYSTASVGPDSNLVGQLVWTNVGPLAIGAGTSLTVDFTAVKSTTPGNTTNTVVSTVTTTNGIPVAPQTSSVPKQVLAPAYVLAKTLVSPLGRPADVGETVVFRLSVTNIGETALSPVRLDDTFDTNYLAYSTASVGPDSNLVGQLVWTNVGPLAIGAGTSLTVDFTAVKSTTPGDTTNTVVSTVTTTNGIPVAPQTSSVPKQVLAPAYVLAKTLVSPLGRPADVGETVRFRLSVTNIGETVLSPVRLDDTFDTNYLAYSTASVGPDTLGIGALTWNNVGPLAVGAGTSLTVDFTAVKSTTPGDTTNTVVSTVTTTNGIPVAPQTSSVPKQVLAPAYLLSKTLVSPLGRPADVGETVVFRLSVTNIGETALSPVRLDDTFDTNYLAYSGASVPPDLSGIGSRTWLNVGPLAVGAGTSLTVDFTAVKSTTPGNTTNMVVSTVTTTNGIPVAPQTSSVPKQVLAPAYLITKVLESPTNRPPIPGESLTFRITVTNNGEVAFDTLYLGDTYETNYLLYVSSSHVPDINVPGSLTWSNIGPLAIGAVTNVTVQFTGVAPTYGLRTNWVVALPGTVGHPPMATQTSSAPYSIDAPCSIGDRVWEDSNYNHTFDGLGLDVPNSLGGQTVTLYRVEGPVTSVVTTTTIDANGFYTFTNLWPAAYFLEFQLPSNHVWALPDVGTNDTVDSDVDRITGRTPVTTLVAGENDMTWDAGIVEFGLIGDTVWLDLDRDGVPDENLAIYGLNNVTVRLYRASAPNVVIATAVTGPGTNGFLGYYEFPHLEFGDYIVRIDLKSVPKWLTVRTTVTNYSVTLGYNTTYFAADFGFTGSPTPVQLKSFTATRTDTGVRIDWETGAELDNLGFNVYRADKRDGARTRVNESLVPGLGTSSGQRYAIVDSAPVTDETWYWLEDVSGDGQTELHGPVRVGGKADEGTGTHLLAATAMEVSTNLLWFTMDMLEEAGVPVSGLPAGNLQVWVNGNEVAAYMSTTGTLRNTDFAAFLVNGSNQTVTCEVRFGRQGKRMEEVYVGPLWFDGSVAAFQAVNSRVGFSLTPEVMYCLLTGFGEEPVWIFDVTDPVQPLLLFGAETIWLADEFGVYFSYPVENRVECVAFDNVVVIRLLELQKAK